ncbi:protein kinase [Pseudoalteromonas sp. NEC-BIFX-2020_015]|uniref:serine/threonine-protein kinase n=1 Tax=Pseudoalteromonas sp. NEC-BIFX-2020_015 TaxID=2729544 RepID=UPI0014615265|nr:serine/threonine-protein kinase [Pseudoalteromonas sp. NEC-BIFX-2020_015]NMR26514.1 protein kinase [Pseudoalteromonas sp. NEC-BIFX-2020_015]
MSQPHNSVEKFNTTIVNYKLIKLLNQGGMGSVYLAEDTRLKRYVAIKLIKVNSTQSAADINVLNEAQLLARLNHPHIVQIHDVLMFEDQLCIVMEYLKGKTLQQFQQQHICCLLDKLNILLQLCAGLSHAHSQQVIHCDLKPANIIIDTDKNILKITDFGIAALHNTESDESVQDLSFGSASAMSPEQIRKEPVDFKSDLFSFGILAYMFISGRHPFGEGAAQALANNIANGKASNAHEIIPALPNELCDLLNQLLQRKKSRRPVNAQSVERRLQDIIIAIKQQEILAQETIPLDQLVVKTKSPKKWRILAAVMGIAAITTGLMYKFEVHKPEEHYVVFLAPEIKMPPLFEADINMVKATIDDAVRQGIINSKHLHLISEDEIKVIEDSNNQQTLTQRLKQLSIATGMQEAVRAELNCMQPQCYLTLVRLEAPNWTVKARKQWPIIIDNYSQMHHSSSQQLTALYPDFDNKYVVMSQLSDKVQIEHIELYQKVQHVGDYSEQLFMQISSAIEQTPQLYANYELLREVALSLYQQSQQDEYLNIASKLLFNSPLAYQNTPAFAKNAMLIAVARQDWSAAIQYLAKAEQVGASTLTLYELKGMLYLHQDKLSEAQSAFELALKIRTNPIIKQNLALVMWWQGDIEKAKQLLNEVISVSPQNYMANQLLADIALTEGDLVIAIKQYKQAINIKADSTDLSNLSIAYSLQGEFEQALIVAQQAVDINPEHVSFRLNLADTQKALSLIESYPANYLKVIELTQDKQTLDGYLEVAQAHSQLGEAKLALQALNKAISISSEHYEYVFTAALVYSVIGEYQSAIMYIEKSLTIGYHPMWFKLPWFKPWCKKEEFITLMQQYDSSFSCGFTLN